MRRIERGEARSSKNHSARAARSSSTKRGLRPRTPNLIRDRELDLVRVAAQFRRVHRQPLGGEGAELAGDFGSQAVGDAVLAAGEAAGEEAHLLVAELDVGAERVARV